MFAQQPAPNCFEMLHGCYARSVPVCRDTMKIFNADCKPAANRNSNDCKSSAFPARLRFLFLFLCETRLGKSRSRRLPRSVRFLLRTSWLACVLMRAACALISLQANLRIRLRGERTYRNDRFASCPIFSASTSRLRNFSIFLNQSLTTTSYTPVGPLCSSVRRTFCVLSNRFSECS